MKIKAEQLQAHLQKQLLPIYVVSGDESLLAQESIDAIRAAAKGHGFTERELFYFEGNNQHYDTQRMALLYCQCSRGGPTCGKGV